MALAPGTPAPDFTLMTLSPVEGEPNPFGLRPVNLAAHRGKQNVVLLFFPAAFTGVCTDELCSITGNIDQYKSLDAAVYGISQDTAFAQSAWAEKHTIGVPLLSDYQKAVTQAFDVVLPDLVGLGPGSKRAAFVIDKEGVIRYAEETPTPLDLPDFEKVKATLSGL